MRPSYSFRLSAALPVLGLTVCLVLMSGCAPALQPPRVIGEAQQPPLVAQTNGRSLSLSPKQQTTIGLSCTPVRWAWMAQQLILTGTVQPALDRVTRVGTPVVGRVMDLYANLGDVVRRGQAMATLRSETVGQLESELLDEVIDLTADREQARVQLNLAQTVYHREQRLYEAKVSALADLEAAQAQLRKAQQTLVSLNDKQAATISMYQERLSLLGVGDGAARQVVATRRLNPIVSLYAPQSGLVIERKINQGEWAVQDAELFTVADLSKVWIVGSVFEQDIARVAQGQAATVRVDSLPGRVFEGQVDYVASILNASTRTLDVRLEAANPGNLLKPNMFVRMNIRTGRQHHRVVPKTALQEVGDKTVVYVRLTSDRFREVPVQVVLEEGPLAAIAQGLKEGDQVVTQGAFFLRGEFSKLKLPVN